MAFWSVVLRQLRCLLISSILAWHLDKEIPYISSKSPKNNTIYDKNRHTLAKNRLIFLSRCHQVFQAMHRRLQILGQAPQSRLRSSAQGVLCLLCARYLCARYMILLDSCSTCGIIAIYVSFLLCVLNDMILFVYHTQIIRE